MNSSHLNISNELPPPSGKCIRDTSITQVIFPCLYSLLFAVGLTLNCLAAWIFFRIPNSTTFVIYLKNVVVVDLLMTVTILIKTISDSGLGSWQLKAFVCRYSAVVFYLTMYISIILLGLISLDRYLKIAKPFGRAFIHNTTFGKVLTVLIWTLMFFITALPNMILTNKTPSASLNKCSSLKGPLGLKWHKAVNYLCQIIFWTVLALMVICYTFISKKVYESYKNSRSNDKTATRKTKARVFIVVAVFFICFAPFHFTRVPYTLSQTGTLSNCRAQNTLYIAKESTMWLSATNTCLDPLIYIFLCKVFRKMLFDTLRLKSKTVQTNETSTNAEETPI
ncbi:P2Y purinoceptor 13-like [Acipenser oxyrinchus oxyrinchus]|uniref:P2Y purinoceptor 13-like n=1 Tax=Acipenser oxyrinchus oxyrinchus TaxID=40147 RepID=A0AAD8D4Q2_ACIOX|nr:P2Y purinoceptor 13-like [Acipenser oxyrinchus oxyrinchus]